MTRTVFCRKYQKELPGMTQPPFPGPKGEDLFNNVSQQAWEEWQAHQTRLINEKHLVMTDFNSRRYLMDQMDRFLSGQDFDQAEGFVPEQDNKR